MELLEAGTSFDLRFELDLPEGEEQQKELLQGLAIALTGFEKGEIGLGARKRRGFGECEVSEWKVEDYNLRDPNGLIAWITGAPGKKASGKHVSEKLGFDQPLPDERSLFKLEAEFRLATSLLIRSGSGSADAPDMIHLHSKRGQSDTSILSGTSLAGAMRARGLRIANTIYNDPLKAKKFVSDIFGPDIVEKQKKRKKGEDPFASRLLVRERAVEGKADMVQTRIRIDRFTGGTFPGALFEQQPVMGGNLSKITMSIELRNPKDPQIGLLLHILKDLWTGDLPLGGEASAGRGRLNGIKADLYLQKPRQEKPEEWHLTPKGAGQIQIVGDRDKLNAYAKNAGGAE
jgi:CRISPR/Cas system CSM-associated protein Csm3 (group 7 of RAMP superfamily)